MPLEKFPQEMTFFMIFAMTFFMIFAMYKCQKLQEGFFSKNKHPQGLGFVYTIVK